MLILTTAMLLAVASGGTLTVDVGNIRNARGTVHIDVCDESHFLKEDCAFSADVPAHEGVVTLVIGKLPAGRYAIQASHDENGNKRVDRGMFGIPTEGVGFSHDARIRLGPPKWDDAVFDFDGKDGHEALRMRYFSGKPGPTPR